MLRHKCGKDETMETFMQRSNRDIRETRQRVGMRNWDEEYYALYYQWAGHVVRFQRYDPGRLTFKVMVYKDYDWIKALESRNGGRQLHGRCLRIWRWEYCLYKYWGKLDWRIEALDKPGWGRHLEQMILWRTFQKL
jgi:hypothetical protein